MDAILWILLPMLVAGGSAVLSYYVMQSRMEVAIAKERETLAEANARIQTLEATLPDKIKLAEETAQRRAFDSFLMDFRVEERRYLRESKSHFMNSRSIVMQERLYFRNIPLSNWVEHEMQLNDGAKLERLDNSSVFSARALSEYSKNSTPAGATVQSVPKYLAS
jgi:hypothetical protein